MKFIYTMFTIAGWGWCVVAGGYLLGRYVAWRRRQPQRRGFEVMEKHEE